MNENKWLFFMAAISLAGLLIGFFWFGIRPARSKAALQSGSWLRKRRYVTLTAINLIVLLLMMLFFYFFKMRQ
jgi:hypothetical protein